MKAPLVRVRVSSQYPHGNGFALSSFGNIFQTMARKKSRWHGGKCPPVAFPYPQQGLGENLPQRIINLKTAKALGLEMPPVLLALADEVIE
jgi:hypothetical protein